MHSYTAFKVRMQRDSLSLAPEHDSIKARDKTRLLRLDNTQSLQLKKKASAAFENFSFKVRPRLYLKF